ncbi:uncharacterized protein LOC106662016 [Cimex lectularius]|uniref:Uncharacterized protein n=1 Tax=Cimex lectularius TaxID=79782 RepID=A0A8I6SMN0_CIMLE|nr:uncharacterized protein LOC106662016 [Cimex lectularius]
MKNSQGEDNRKPKNSKSKLDPDPVFQRGQIPWDHTKPAALKEFSFGYPENQNYLGDVHKALHQELGFKLQNDPKAIHLRLKTNVYIRVGGVVDQDSASQSNQAIKRHPKTMLPQFGWSHEHNANYDPRQMQSHGGYAGNDKLEAKASRFKVSDLQGRTLFSADKNEVVVGADLLRLQGAGGVVIDGSLQTPLVRANPGSDLSLESPTRSLQVMAPSGVSLESRAGDISATCLTDLKLESMDGAIRLEAARILLPGLKTAHSRPQPRGRQSFQPASATSTVFQLCSCHNGKLFLAPADGLCATDNEKLLCR